MKNIIKKSIYLSLFIALNLVISSCTQNEAGSDASKVVPIIEGINGEAVVFEGESHIYTLNPYRGGSEYIWNVTGADMQPVEGRADQINVTFNQFALPVSISASEKAFNGSTSDPLTIPVTVFGTPCDWTLEMQDTYGDGWNGASVVFTFEGTVLGEYTLGALGANVVGTETIAVPAGGNLTVSYKTGAWDSEVIYRIYDSSGNLVFQDGTNPTVGADVFTIATVCQ